MERIPSAQPPPASLSGMDLSHMYHVFKPRKGLKRCEDSKDTYKLPHRLIEKKRRDRINECIAQLKDLLPEHLKLTTLGHLEKAVVLELTLKHLRSLSSLIEQQQQQILALQRGSPCEGSRTSGEEMFLSGFQLCAEEALRFLQDGEQCELVSHLHRVASNISQSPTRTQISPKGTATNCVPVIQRAAPLPPSEQSGSDTDTDSGYGEVEKYTQEKQGVLKEEGTVSPKVDMVIKQEPEETPRKRSRIEAFEREHRICSSDIQSMASYPNPHPLCLPFYLIPPSASTYLPMLDKCWYPGSMPMLYPVLPHSGSAVSPLDSSSLLQALKKVPTIGMDTKE